MPVESALGGKIEVRSSGNQSGANGNCEGPGKERYRRVCEGSDEDASKECCDIKWIRIDGEIYCCWDGSVIGVVGRGRALVSRHFANLW